MPKAEPVGVIGAGTFGTAMANLLARNTDVLVYSRNPELTERLNRERFRFGVPLNARIRLVNDFAEVAERCQLILPIVPSNNFRDMMQSITEHLRPSHVLIHGTKGLDVTGLDERHIPTTGIDRKNVHTMTDVIRQESVVVRVGALTGPNLARELLDGQPSASVIASKFDEVIDRAKVVLKSRQLHVFGTHDLLGAELAGVLKNVIALGSGILKGVGLGKNIQAMLITRGLVEMVHFGQALGSDKRAFFGTAGIGDLIATATSKKSRNYMFGYRIGSGESLEEVMATSQELAEGVRTLMITRHLARSLRLRVPITEMLYQIVFEQYPVAEAMNYLITYPYDVDVDFL
ncbi:glycerol-3-phosphate dehydrogenase (NAD(P)+) [Lewinella marina]|uniref:Glycerol-3-phosphate dehydrogenase [NAD(P)+] n=1 Tax=Neolewinella marina TaxID=438751 RepID=A0A2G0CJ37_9BACT|nr:NAD(P)H-dependent glycerol-3-phosphate dehydrogenase [Neolewinella marina]NJB84927.1 glycerol-3-phosphate dehydrogenase (NAD(P)+) [Neolewinella marina]PHK99920.1 glycerol 3-phosphate dehydrogenase [Neolewinella marina]